MTPRFALIVVFACGLGGTLVAQLTPPPLAHNERVLALKQHLHDLTHEFAALEAGRFVPPAPGEPVDDYTLNLVQGAHTLEDLSIFVLELPLYDMATAKTEVDRSRAMARLRYGVGQIRVVIGELGPQWEYNEADVLVRLRGALLQIEALPGVRP